MSAPVTLFTGGSFGGRTFVLRDVGGRFPFEVTEVCHGVNRHPTAYSIRNLAQRDLDRRVSDANVQELMPEHLRVALGRLS